MSALASRAGEATGKRGQVLDAAEACFVRHGFHRTSMNDIAREAAMSSANLYRYFASKEALTVGLVEREGERGAALVDSLRDDGDARAELLGIADRYFLALGRDAAVLRLEIWAEATRNPGIAAVVRASDGAFRAWLADMLAKLATSPGCDPEALCAALVPLLQGAVVAHATVPDHDSASMAAHFRATLDAGLAGRLASVRRHEAAR